MSIVSGKPANHGGAYILPKNESERHELIAKEAYLLAEKRGFEPGFEKCDWQSAEQQIDSRIFKQAIQPNQFYKSLMIKFFSSVDIDGLTSLGIAHAFFNFICDNERLLGNSKELWHASIVGDRRNVSLLTDDTDISSLTKRSILLSNSTLLSHSSVNYKQYREDTDFAPIDFYPDTFEFYEVNCPDPTGIGLWLKSCKELLEYGDVFYLPRIQRIHETRSYWNWTGSKDISSNDHFFEGVISSKKVVGMSSGNALKTNLIRVIAQVEIPVIEEVDLMHFSKISIDERREFEKFRDYIDDKFKSIAVANESQFFDSDIRLIGRQIERDFNLLTSDFKNISRKRTINIIGATVITVMATLVAVNGQYLNEIMTILTGGGGGIAALWKIIEEYNEKRGQLSANDCYYLWLLDKH